MYKLKNLNNNVLLEGENLIITDNNISIEGTKLTGLSFDGVKLYKDDVEIDIADEVADQAFDVKALKTLAILCNKRFTGAVSGAITKAEFLTEYKK